MSKERFKVFAAVALMLMRENNGKEEILFQKRQNTGYANGCYDFSATGHVEENESMTEAVIREAKEELDIEVKKEDLEFVCMSHRNDKEVYCVGYFKASKWKGEPKINEPEKNEEIRWVDIDNIPQKIVPGRDNIVHNYKNGIRYDEFAW